MLPPLTRNSMVASPYLPPTASRRRCEYASYIIFPFFQAILFVTMKKKA